MNHKVGRVTPCAPFRRAHGVAHPTCTNRFRGSMRDAVGEFPPRSTASSRAQCARTRRNFCAPEAGIVLVNVPPVPGCEAPSSAQNVGELRFVADWS